MWEVTVALISIEIQPLYNSKRLTGKLRNHETSNRALGRNAVALSLRLSVTEARGDNRSFPRESVRPYSQDSRQSSSGPSCPEPRPTCRPPRTPAPSRGSPPPSWGPMTPGTPAHGQPLGGCGEEQVRGASREGPAAPLYRGQPLPLALTFLP